MSSARKKTILLIEDNPDDAHLTLAAFKEAGIDANIVVAADGVVALKLLYAAEELPALVLMDLNLPKLSGHEILQRIRSDPRAKSVPVVILTSSLEPEDLARCYALGANSFVCKPVDFRHFVETTRLLGRYWTEVNVVIS